MILRPNPDLETKKRHRIHRLTIKHRRFHVGMLTQPDQPRHPAPPIHPPRLKLIPSGAINTVPFSPHSRSRTSIRSRNKAVCEISRN